MTKTNPPKRKAVGNIVKPLHPTVAAEFEMFSAPALNGGKTLYFWLRGDAASEDCTSQAECEKSALAHLRSLPVR